MSGSMRAVLLKGFGDSSRLYLGETELPVVKEDYVLIRVHAFGLNRADIVQRQGHYPPPAGASTVLGLECAGEIVELGPASASFATAAAALSVGQRVMALLAGGGYSQFAVAHVGCVIPMPASYSFEQAAATVEVFITAYQLMRYICKVKAGEVVLVHAGASGVGTAAIKLANHFGAKAIATVGQESKVDFCMRMGAAAALNYKQQDWLSAAKALLSDWGAAGVDVVLDPVGSSHAAANAELLQQDGRWVFFAMLSGSVVKNFDLAPIYRKRLMVTGSMLRARTVEYKAELVRSFVSELWTALDSGQLRMEIDRVLDWADIQQAHQWMEADKTMGKIVCTVNT